MSEKEIRFIVTGFGPFGGVPLNPTMELVASLIPYIQKTRDDVSLGNRTQTKVIETSAIAARHEIEEIVSRLDPTVVTVVLHLGVNAGANHFQLESCAYNDASFRIPDERGERPWREAIAVDLPVGTQLESCLDVQGLVNDLHELGLSQSIRFSSDPGRFVCNYTYCLSLCSLSTHRQCPNPSSQAYCLFLHVPPFRCAGEEIQLRLVYGLMKAIEKQIESL